jgi:hypothetical protein
MSGSPSCAGALIGVHEPRRHLTATALRATAATTTELAAGSAAEHAHLHLHAQQNASFNRQTGAFRRRWFHAKHIVTAFAHPLHSITLNIIYSTTARRSASTGAG